MDKLNFQGQDNWKIPLFVSSNICEIIDTGKQKQTSTLHAKERCTNKSAQMHIFFTPAWRKNKNTSHNCLVISFFPIMFFYLEKSWIWYTKAGVVNCLLLSNSTEIAYRNEQKSATGACFCVMLPADAEKVFRNLIWYNLFPIPQQNVPRTDL